jgi:ferredoxin
MHISIDSTKCVGHGRCYTLAASLVDADDEGRGVADGVVPVGQEEAAREAAANCPESAVVLTL